MLRGLRQGAARAAPLPAPSGAACSPGDRGSAPHSPSKSPGSRCRALPGAPLNPSSPAGLQSPGQGSPPPAYTHGPGAERGPETCRETARV